MGPSAPSAGVASSFSGLPFPSVGSSPIPAISSSSLSASSSPGRGASGASNGLSDIKVGVFCGEVEDMFGSGVCNVCEVVKSEQ